MVQTIAGGINGKITVGKPFKESSFTVTEKESQYSLIIRNVSKEDEATYFCQKGTVFEPIFFNGTFLAVNGKNNLCLISMSIYVFIHSNIFLSKWINTFTDACQWHILGN